MTDWGPFSLKGKNAIVTGGAMGIGFAIAKRYVEGGANVLVADVDGPAAEAAVEALAGASGKIESTRTDMSDLEQVAEMVEECVRQFGSVDVLVNNAGIYPQVPMLEMSSGLFDRVYEVNLRGLAFASKFAGQRMVRQRTGGSIVNIGSIDSIHPSMVGLAAYDSSKGGVLMFTKSFALEMAPQSVRVNMIAPGGIVTEGSSKLLEGSGMTAEEARQVLERFAVTVPMKRMGEPDDIATVAVFLASDAARYMTGETVVVDGGKLLA